MTDEQKTVKIKIVKPKVKLPEVKYCIECDLVKLVKEFYKTGYKQKFGSRCKPCSNIFRQRYKIKRYPNNYMKREKGVFGFAKLPAETRKNIQYDLYIKKSKKSIAREYKLCYGTFLKWCTEGKVPPYSEE